MQFLGKSIYWRQQWIKSLLGDSHSAASLQGSVKSSSALLEVSTATPSSRFAPFSSNLPPFATKGSLQTGSKHHQVILICLALFFSALVVRLGHGLTNINFGQDQARDAYIMRTSQEQGKIFLPMGPRLAWAIFIYLPFTINLIIGCPLFPGKLR